MNQIAEYFKALENDIDYSIAPLWKRLLSSLIDLTFIYLLYFMLRFVTRNLPVEFDFYKYLILIVFIFSVLTQYSYYMMGGRTIGDLCLKIKPIFIVKNINKKFAYIQRSFLKSTIYMPLGLSYISLVIAIIMILGVVLFLIDPKTRFRRVMPWDSSTGMLVINYSISRNIDN